MHTLHLISHTHWDREWYLTFQQFRLKLVRLVDNLLDILDADPQYRHFMLDGQTIVLDDYLEIRPERAGDLRRCVQEGRILIGPWYLLPDEFLVSPESTIRNLLEGERISSRFGPKMMVGYVPDPFGHIGQMPQILRGFGIETASVMRGLADEPNEFWWQAPDGSRVLMGFMRNGYGNAAGILNGGLDGFVAEARRERDALAPFGAAPHILLMHGVDHQEANPLTSAAVAYAVDKLDGDCLIHSTLPAYFEAIKSELDLASLPVVTGELRSSKRSPLLPAVLSARMWVKQRNRACETLLEKWVEPFSAWAQQGGDARQKTLLQKPSAAVHHAWRVLMQCHPHDSICGCSIDAVHDEMRARFDQVEQIGEELTRQSLAALAEQITTLTDTKDADSAIIVFNPASTARADLVSTVLEALPESGAFDLVDETGAPVPFQTVGLGSSDIFRAVMKRKEFGDAFGMVSDGIVMGWKVREMNVRREGAQGMIEMVLIENGTPNLRAWEQGRQTAEALLADPAVTSYNLSARSADAVRLQFAAPRVPEHGYRTLWVRAKPAEPKTTARPSPLVMALLPLAARVAGTPGGKKLISRMSNNPAGKPPYRIENEYFTVEAQPDGTLDVLDKAGGTLYRGQNRLVDGGDRGDEYNFSPPARDRLVAARMISAKVERGAAQQVIEMTLELAVPAELSADRKSRGVHTVKLPVACRVALTHGVPRVDIHTEVDNQARDHRLRAHFSAPFAVDAADYDGHFEIVRRAVSVPTFDDTWVEQPRPETSQRAFTAVADGQDSLLIANRGLPEAEVLRRDDGNAEIAITLLRCVGWLSRDDFPERNGHAGPAMETPGAQMPGKWSFDYAIIPHKAADRLAAVQQAYAFQAPLRAVSAGLHAGDLPAVGSFLQVEPGEFIISAVKEAEDGRGWLARGSNLGDTEISVTLRTPRPFIKAERITLAEEHQADLDPIDQQAVNFTARPHEVVTVLFS